MESMAVVSPRIKCVNRGDRSATSVTTFGSNDSSTSHSASSIQTPEPEFLLSSALGNELSHHINEFISSLSSAHQWRAIFYPLQTALNLQLPLSQLIPMAKTLVKESPYKWVLSLTLQILTVFRPVRFISAEILANHMRSSPVIEHREIYKFITDLMTSEQCRDRECFIKLVPILVEIFSKKFFKKHFYDKVLQLSNDRVPNVRYQICRLLPLIKVMTPFYVCIYP